MKRLILIMLAAIVLLLPTKVSVAGEMPSCILESVDHNNDRPHWKDLGMDHILAVGGQSNITPPSPVRLASQGRRLVGGNSHSTGVSPEAVLHEGKCFRNVQCAERFPVSWTKGYLYVIQCLRL